MKKLLLLLTAGVVSFGANAQENKPGSMVLVDYSNHKKAQSISDIIPNYAEKRTERANAQNKPTAGGSRTYNYVGSLAALDGSILNNFNNPYMWFDLTGMAIYQGTSGLELDTITVASLGSVLHPQADALNDPFYYDDFYPYPSNPVAIKNESYKLDSLTVYGAYGRNPNKWTVVDTLRFAIVYGNGDATSNMPLNSYTADMTANFGHATVSFLTLPYDSVSNTATSVVGGPTVVIKDIYLDSFANSMHTGANAFTVPVDLTIPGGNSIGVSVTFKSGDDSFIPYDTVFTGSGNTNGILFKYGMFRPTVFEERDGQFPRYTPGNYNSGYVRFLPLPDGWRNAYIPMTAFSLPEFPYEYLDLDYHISCATCKNVEDYKSVKNVSNIISKISAYPNPANDHIVIPVTVGQSAKVQVSLVNTVGQVIDAQDLGSVVSGGTATAKFNTANLSNGVYLYTVEAAGQRQTGRFVVSR